MAEETASSMNIQDSCQGVNGYCRKVLVGMLITVFVLAALWAYISMGLDDIRAQAKLDELKTRSPAHEQILTGYYRCMQPRKNPGQLACIGAVSKGAELLGIKASVVASVLVDAGLIAAPVKVEAVPAQP